MQGIFSKLFIVQDFLESHSNQIVCFTEHFLTQSDLNVFCIPVYTTATGYCRPCMKKGGVCILVFPVLNYHVIDVSEYCMEGICELAAIRVENNNAKLFVMTVYRPPSQVMSTILDFLSRPINSCLEELTKINNQIVFVGDFNINFAVDVVRRKWFKNLTISHG